MKIRIKDIIVSVGVLLSVATVTPAKACLIGKKCLIRGDAGRSADKVQEVVVKKPIKIIEKTAKGTAAVSGLKTLKDILLDKKSLRASLKESLKKAKDMHIAHSEIPLIANGAENLGVDVIRGAVGEDAASGVSMLLLPRQIARQLPSALLSTGIKVSEGEDAGMVVGVPLHTALKQAHSYYEPKSKPLPKKILDLLGLTMDKVHLKKVRYVVDSSGATLPALINFVKTQLEHKYGDNYGVVVGNVIIFAKEPKGVKDLWFWAHEVEHTNQYAKLGFDGFAAQYTKNFKSIEDEADKAADQVVKQLQTVLAALSG